MAHGPQGTGTSIDCPHCGGRARLFSIEPHARLPLVEVRTYECTKCGQAEIVVVPLKHLFNLPPSADDDTE